MSEMASWFKTRDGIIFLTDEDIIAWHEQRGKGTKEIEWRDFVGHQGICQVFNLNTYAHKHIEGFEGMPGIIKKSILDGKMDMMFAHADNLKEATPEFIPLMQRLATRFEKVKRQLANNPYNLITKNCMPDIEMRMSYAVKHKFDGSTIGNLLMHKRCTPKATLEALKGFPEHFDKLPHLYYTILNNKRSDAAVCNQILSMTNDDNILFTARKRLGLLTTKTTDVSKLKIKQKKIKMTGFGYTNYGTHKKTGKAIVRSLA